MRMRAINTPSSTLAARASQVAHTFQEEEGVGAASGEAGRNSANDVAAVPGQGSGAPSRRPSSTRSYWQSKRRRASAIATESQGAHGAQGQSGSPGSALEAGLLSPTAGIASIRRRRASEPLGADAAGAREALAASQLKLGSTAGSGSGSLPEEGQGALARQNSSTTIVEHSSSTSIGPGGGMYRRGAKLKAPSGASGSPGPVKAPPLTPDADSKVDEDVLSESSDEDEDE